MRILAHGGSLGRAGSRMPAALVGLALRGHEVTWLGAGAPPPAFIQHAPLAGGALELAAAAVIPRRRDAWAVRDVAAA
ncbi:MAG: hypothetical protein AAB113_02665, partial [Candidatus Eisenbacteria bacterium]